MASGEIKCQRPLLQPHLHWRHLHRPLLQPRPHRLLVHPPGPPRGHWQLRDLRGDSRLDRHPERLDYFRRGLED